MRDIPSPFDPTLEQAVRTHLLTSADQVAAAASRLRAAIAQGRTPPQVGVKLAAYLEDLANRMRSQAQEGSDE